MKLIVILFTFLGISAKTQEGNLKKQSLSKTTEITNVKPSCRKLGEELYLKHCSICHGRHGDGKGILHDSMAPKPTNFQKQTYYKKDSKKDLAYIIEILKKGVPQTSMAKFTHILKTKEALECTSKYVQRFKKEKN